MKRKVARLRLSPNEEAQLIREEHERRRKLRIQQVREQERYIALQIRSEVQRRRRRELQNLEEDLKEDWERHHTEKLVTLQRLYQESLQLLGQGHRSAKENEPDWAALAQREEENQTKAEERYREALKDLKSQKQKDHEEQNRSIKARKKALQAEKERSSKVASLPPPPPNPIEQSIDSKKPHVVKKSDVNAFSATHYHMPETTVDKEADTTQPNAHEEAELEVRRLQELGREAEREREEQLEKARLRGKHALRREQLMQDRERFLVELEHMQQTDLLRRRQQVSQMPPQIFQPLYKRQEMREDCQREMEFAFEDMYTGERRVKGDLVLQLVPEPLPAPSTGSQDQELDVTLDDVATPEAEHSHHDTEQEARTTEQETSAQAEPSRPAPRRALKKLLDRIRSQRDQRCSRSSRVPAVDFLTAIMDQIPERDTTIDTGSLTSEERDKPPPTNLKLPEPSQSPPALETTEESTVAGTQRLPDVLADRIREFEEERKKREEELQREKQQQIALLQELEEQKARLEQMLLEAQQERENLKASVTQEVPVHDQEVTPGLATQPVPAASEDDHSRRIREYQQQLLEQNRLHKRSVEVARQRLEEYQRALRLRYNMTATSLLPSVVPTGVIHPPLHCPEGAIPLAPPLQLPTGSAMPAYIPGAHVKPPAPVEIPTRQSNILAPPLPPSGPVLNTRTNLGVDSRSLPVQLQISANTPSDQRAGITAWLTDNIMDRVTEHLPTTDPRSHRPFTTHHSTTTGPLQPSSDPIRTISPNITGGPLPLPHQALAQPGTFLHGSSQSRPLASREDDMERQRSELQEVQRRVLEQREVMAQQQRQQEEERRRQEEREQMRRQREALQALINTDVQPAPEAANEVLVSEDIGTSRLRLLASLLRAIEESNGGTLSHLEDHREQGSTAHQQPPTSGPTNQSDALGAPALPPDLCSGLHLPPRVPKPPVARVRLGIAKTMTEQHELSTIQEVETPLNASLVTGSEDGVMLLPNTAAWVPQEEPEPSVASDGTLHTPSVSSGGQQSAGRGTGSGTGSGRSSNMSWRERLLMEAGTSPELPETDPILPNRSPHSSDSGRGADYPGPAFTSYRSPTESAYRPPDPNHLSSTTISTGSYVTTDPEQDSTHTVGDSPPLARLGVERTGGASLLDVSSPSGQSYELSYNKDNSPPGPPSLAVDSLFHDSSIQRIIDKYTRELNISLNTAGNASASSADGEGSYLQDPSCSVSQQSGIRFLERTGEEERPADSQSPPSDSAGAQSHGLEWDNTVNRILERFSDQVSSFAQDQGQDSSFRPLIGQLADQSSCLPAEHRDTTVGHLIGQPSAHSSMIGQPPGQSVSVSMDQGGWDSTVGRMIGRLSHHSSSHWLSGGHDFYASQLIGQMELERSSAWLDEGREESQMRPLVGELDESAGQRSGSSGERTSVDLGGSAQAAVPSDPLLAPEAQRDSFPVPQDQTLQTTTSPPEQEPDRSEAFPASDSFHPLLAEVTHNETADPSMTFHLPEQEIPSSPEGSGQSPSGERSRSIYSEEEFEAHAEPSVESDPSPERLRAEELACRLAATTTLQDSFYQLTTSQCHSHESVLLVSPAAQEVELTALSLSNLTLCDAPPTLDLPLPEGGDAERTSVLRQPGGSIPVSDLGAGEPSTQQDSNQKNAVPVWDKIQEAAREKGILEESQITLVSLTDTTLQDQEATITEEEERRGEEGEDEKREEHQTEQKAEESTLLPEETPAALKEESTQSHAVMLLEFQRSPSEHLQEALQQKRRALLQRSSHRVQEIKAKRALAKTQPVSQHPSEAKEQSKAKEPQPISCKAKTKSEPQLESNTKLKGGQAEDQTTEMSSCSTAGNSKQKKPQPPPPVGDARLKKVGKVKICTPEQRKQDASEMYQRTQRLYEQLEEVKHQKEIRSRQEACAKNRLKAKEFHKKTLQKLRTKQTPR